jgi:hypothetical protein
VIQSAALISPAYRQLQQQLHAAPRGYGGRGDKWAAVVLQLAVQYDAISVLDYGCGQGALAKALRGSLKVAEYDPAIPGKDARPSFADLVVCTDVLEHIEPDRLTAVLSHLHMLARKAVFVVVSVKASNKVLADGRNAHLTIKPDVWWEFVMEHSGFVCREAPILMAREPEREWLAVLEPQP